MILSDLLSEKLRRAVEDMGFTEATPIQEQAIPPALEGGDLIGQAQTGTGKTAAFAIPILQRIDTEDRRTQAIVLCPTRELAMQNTEEFKKLAKYMPEVEPLAVYGGQPIDIQLRALKRCPQVVIGTPGRVIDHIRRKTLDLSSVKIVTLDEADNMLDMGFREDIAAILESVPASHQTLLFSATMPRPILELAGQYLTNPVHIKTIVKNMTVSAIEQIYMEVKERRKLETLTRLVDFYSPKLSLVFCNTKKKVDEVVDGMNRLGYKAEGLHGDLRQPQRDAIMNKFRGGNLELLVATDVAARGIDVDDIEIVFNYDLPYDAEYYTHRIGRTGRAGKTGKAFTFVTGRELLRIQEIIRITRSDIKPGVIPAPKEAEARKARLFTDDILAELQKDQDLSSYRVYVDALENDGIDLKDFLAAIFKKHLSADKKAEIFRELEDRAKTAVLSDRIFSSDSERRPRQRRERSPEGSYGRFDSLPSSRSDTPPGEGAEPSLFRRDFSSSSTEPYPRRKPSDQAKPFDSARPAETRKKKPYASGGVSSGYSKSGGRSGYSRRSADSAGHSGFSRRSDDSAGRFGSTERTSPSPKKKNTGKKKTIYNGPDLPRTPLSE